MDRGVPHGQPNPDAQSRDDGPYGFPHDHDDHLAFFPQHSTTTNTYNPWGVQGSTTAGGATGNGNSDLVHGGDNAWQQPVHSINPLHSQPVSHFDNPFSGAYSAEYGSHNLQGSPYGYQPDAHNFDSFNLDLNNEASYGGLADINGGPYGHLPSFGEQAAPTQTISPSALHNPLSPYGQLSLNNADDDPNVDPANGFSTDLNIFQTPVAYQGSANTNVSTQPTNLNNVKVPQGVRQGDFWIPDLKRLATVTNSKRLKSYLFVSDDTVPSVEKGKLTDILKRRSGVDKDGKSMRPSRNDCLARVKSQQGNRAFSNVQKAYFKTLSSQTTVSTKPNERFTSAAQSPPEAESSEESEESSASSESDVDEDAEHPPLPSVRPTDPVEAAEYDVIKVVWAPSYASPGAEAIRTALRDHWKILQPIVGSWRKAKDGLKESTAPRGDSDRLKSQAERYRKILERILSATVKHGHQDIVGFFGENKQLFVLFYQLLVDRYVASDCDGQLVQDILSLMVRYNSIDSATWESAKLDKVVPKIEKKAKSDQVKSLAKQILQLVVDYKEKDLTKKADDTVSAIGPKAEGNGGSSSAIRGKGEVLSSRKNASRDSTPASSGAIKRHEPKLKKPGADLATKASTITSKPGTRPNTIKASGVTSANTSNNPSSNPAVKIKANPVTAKPTSFFSSLQSASKKPGTSNAAIKTSQQNSSKSSEKKDNLSSNVSEVKATPKFSFAETLANIAKPKEIPSELPSKPEIIETPEEKAKRLRKEERRKLRVHFKPDDELVEIRMLTHDPEEDLGHDDTLTRDAGDLRGEARSFKMHRDQNERLDDDDEGMTAGAAAAATENTSLNAQSGHFDNDRSSESQSTTGNYSHQGQTHGASVLDSIMKMFKDPNSSIRELLANQNPAQQSYHAQIPQTKQTQPYQQSSFPSSQGQIAQTPQARTSRTGYDLYYAPKEEWWKLAGSLGKIDSREKLEELFRLYPQKPPEQAPAPPPASMQSQQYPTPVPQAQSLPPNMQAILASLANPAASQPTSTPVFPNPNTYQYQNQDQQQQLANAVSGLNMAQLQSLLGAASAQQQVQPPNANLFPPFQAPFTQVQAQAPPAQGFDVQALLNQLAMSQCANPSQTGFGLQNAQPPATFQPFNFGFQVGQPGANMQQPPTNNTPNYGYSYQENQQQLQQPNNPAQNYDNQQGGRHFKRKRDGDDGDRNDFLEGKNNRGGGKKPYLGVPTKPCKWYKEGKCKKGSDCTYIHEDS